MLLSDLLEDEARMQAITTLAKKVSDTFSAGKKVLICGNGGSACDAMHFAQEFTGRFRGHRKALPVIALSDPTHITCVGNDYGFEAIFERGVEAHGQQGDLFIGLSTSGNSTNVIKAKLKAQELGLTTCCLLGKDGGQLKGTSDWEIIIPGLTSDRIQELHMLILHTVIELVERQLFPKNYA